ncbi:MAG: hypothetical protein MJE66_24795, partial [Proteobacteria bacterium]|nr:hypothetical protein [Pseudomonadota bacterium]
YTRGCGTLRSLDYWGDRANRAPSNYTDGRVKRLSGTNLNPTGGGDIHGEGGRLLNLTEVPPFDSIFALGATNVDATVAPVIGALFAVRHLEGSIDNSPFPQGPWNTDFRIKNIGALASVPNTTTDGVIGTMPGDQGLVLRPLNENLFVPSAALRERLDDFDSFDQNISQNELSWNHGAGQDEHELKEAYLDIEMFDHRLWLRLGKQNIVWGKTELFRTTDQFNPQDLALSSLPSLEESRLAQWSARGVWSFYDVGPLQDVRLELAVNLDDFEPVDLGRCGEPYTPFLVCGKSGGLFAHGLSGTGLAGEERPPNWWEDIQGLEGGVRLEFRWERFSFALVDFYGYSDSPYVEYINEYQRRVDPLTGRPLDVRGREFVDPTLPISAQDADAIRRQADLFHTGNRQLFDVLCSVSVGIAAAAGPALEPLADACLVDVPNRQTVLDFGLMVPVAGALTVALTGNNLARALIDTIAPGAGSNLVELNQDGGDTPLNTDDVGAFCENPFNSCLRYFTTPSQQALLGCGPFYGNNCDLHGIDLFNTEASVLLQAAPGFEATGPIGTRFAAGVGSVVLPGARAPTDPGYDPLIDGCVAPGPAGCGAASALSHPLTGDPFRNEMGALSWNFVMLLAALGAANDADCVPTDPQTCRLVRGLVAVTGVQRPEIRAGGNGRLGRRDFLWHGGGEAVLRYNKRNVLGLSMDFAEDRTKTNWSFELTWINKEVFFNSFDSDYVDKADVYNLTVSVDRPTFINFLNPNRTFFINSQWFMRWIEGYRGNRAFTADGPFSVLGTLSFGTGYFQDRLLPNITVIHDFMSHSGGAIMQIGYRFNEVMSLSVGGALFYGGPGLARIPDRQIGITNNGGSFETRTNFQGLSAISERDEVFMRVRYTF